MRNHKFEGRATSCEMTDSKTAENWMCLIIMKPMKTPSPSKEDSSADECYTGDSCASVLSSDESSYICPNCGRQLLVSKHETSSEDEQHELSTTSEDSDYSLSEDNSIYTTSGSGYNSMDSSSSFEDSERNNEYSDTSSYYCDRSASESSTDSVSDAFYSESMSEDDSNLISLPERKYLNKEVFIMKNEE